MRLNHTGYRGSSQRLLSGALGVCLMGVKKEPTVKRNTYHCLNVGSARVGLGGLALERDWASCG